MNESAKNNHYSAKLSRFLKSSCERRGLFWIIFVAFMLTLLATGIISHFQRIYFLNHPFHLDASYYTWQTIFDLYRLQNSSRIYVAFTELLWNDRFAMRSIPGILLAPNSLGSPIGPLFTAMPCLFFFLSCLGVAIFQQCKSCLYTCASMSFFATIPAFYNCLTGLGTFWLDPAGALIVGAAVVCVLQNSQSKSTCWLYLFGALTGFASMVRYLSIAYLVILCLPVLLADVFRRLPLDRDRHYSARRIIIAAIFFFLSGGVYAIGHFWSNFNYYRLWSSDFDHGVAWSALLVMNWLFTALGPVHLFGLFALLVTQLVSAIRQQAFPNLQTCAIFVWLSSAVLVLVIFILHLSTTCHPAIYALPPLVISLIYPNSLCNYKKFSRKLLFTLSISLLLLSVGSLTVNIPLIANDATQPSALTIQTKRFNTQVAKFLSQRSGNFFWLSFIDDNAYDISCEGYFNYRTFAHIPPLGFLYFTSRNFFVPGTPESTPATKERLEAVLNATKKWIDYVLVFDEIDSVNSKFWISSQIARDEAKAVASMVRADSCWHREAFFTSDYYGKVAIYHNLSCGHQGFDAMMRGQNTLPEFNIDAK